MARQSKSTINMRGKSANEAAKNMVAEFNADFRDKLDIIAKNARAKIKKGEKMGDLAPLMLKIDNEMKKLAKKYGLNTTTNDYGYMAFLDSTADLIIEKLGTIFGEEGKTRNEFKGRKGEMIREIAAGTLFKYNPADKIPAYAQGDVTFSFDDPDLGGVSTGRVMEVQMKGISAGGAKFTAVYSIDWAKSKEYTKKFPKLEGVIDGAVANAIEVSRLYRKDKDQFIPTIKSLAESYVELLKVSSDDAYLVMDFPLWAPNSDVGGSFSISMRIEQFPTFIEKLAVAVPGSVTLFQKAINVENGGHKTAAMVAKGDSKDSAWKTYNKGFTLAWKEGMASVLWDLASQQDTIIAIHHFVPHAFYHSRGVLNSFSGKKVPKNPVSLYSEADIERYNSRIKGGKYTQDFMRIQDEMFGGLESTIQL